MIAAPPSFQGTPILSHCSVPTPDPSPFLSLASPCPGLRQGGGRGGWVGLSSVSSRPPARPPTWPPRTSQFFQGDFGEAGWGRSERLRAAEIPSLGDRTRGMRLTHSHHTQTSHGSSSQSLEVRALIVPISQTEGLRSDCPSAPQ